MGANFDRRRFLKSAGSVGATAGVAGWSGLWRFCPISAAEAHVTPDLIRFNSATEPIIQLILATPRESCIEVFIDQFAAGMPYRHFLAALYLSAIRAGQWHSNPFDHNAYAVHSAHQLALDLPVQEMLLPALWALDNLKGRALEPVQPPIKISGKLPAGNQAASELRAGIEGRDEERAVRAVIAMSRSQGASRVGQSLWEFASRDWTFIGHLAILASNSWRLLQTIGWQHAEPVLRYVVSGFTGGKGSQSDLLYFAENAARVESSWQVLPGDWAADGADTKLTGELLSALRKQDADGAGDLAISQLKTGRAKANAVWDAVFLSAGEMIACAQKNSTPLHANTAANALRYAFDECGETQTRLLILLQALAWMTRFRAGMAEQGWFKDEVDLTTLAQEPIAEATEDASREILATLSHGGLGRDRSGNSPVPGWHGLSYNHQPWRRVAAQQAFALAQRQDGTETLFRMAARLLPAKADGDPHRIKFATAMFENHRWVSQPWRPHLVAAASYSFLGADALDTPTIQRVRKKMGAP
jgi:hypothetical protein